MTTPTTQQRYMDFRIVSEGKFANVRATGNARQRRIAVRKWLSSGFAVEKRSLVTSCDRLVRSEWVVVKAWPSRLSTNTKS